MAKQAQEREAKKSRRVVHLLLEQSGRIYSECGSTTGDQAYNFSHVTCPRCGRGSR